MARQTSDWYWNHKILVFWQQNILLVIINSCNMSYLQYIQYTKVLELLYCIQVTAAEADLQPLWHGSQPRGRVMPEEGEPDCSKRHGKYIQAEISCKYMNTPKGGGPDDCWKWCYSCSEMTTVIRRWWVGNISFCWFFGESVVSRVVASTMETLRQQWLHYGNTYAASEKQVGNLERCVTKDTN